MNEQEVMMENLDEIKARLDVLYQEYQKNKSQLSNAKTKETVRLLTDMTFSENAVISDVVNQLSRFSADIVKRYFNNITQSRNVPIGLIDEILEELFMAAKKDRKSQYYVAKFVFAVSAVMKNYGDKAVKSDQLPRMVEFISRYAVKSERNKDKFQQLVNNTMGGIYMLDYSSINKNSLLNIWNATKSIYPDLSKAKYEDFITDWAKKYGFIENKAAVKPDNVAAETHADKETKSLIANNAEAKSVVKGSKPTDKEKAVDRNVGKTSQQTVNSNLETAKKDSTETTECNEENRVSDVSDAHEKEDSKLASADKTAAKSVSMNDNDNVSSARESTSVVDNNNENETAVLLETLSMKLYNSISQDLSRQKDAVISAIAESGAALSKSLGLLQGEVNNSRDVATENVRLKTRIAELEQQLAEQTVRIHEADNSIKLLESEMNDINTKFAAIQSKNAELDTKLAEAYAINSRESSLEAERIRSELKKAFIYLYEDWLEYEFSDVSEENYESLQAIIKKIFRSLERNGIDFKGSNE